MSYEIVTGAEIMAFSPLGGARTMHVPDSPRMPSEVVAFSPLGGRQVMHTGCYQHPVFGPLPFDGTLAYYQGPPLAYHPRELCLYDAHGPVMVDGFLYASPDYGAIWCGADGPPVVVGWDLFKSIGDAVNTAVKAVGNVVQDVGKTAQQVVKTVDDAGKWVNHAIQDAGRWVSQAQRDATQWINTAVKDIGKFVETHDPIVATINALVHGVPFDKALGAGFDAVKATLKDVGPYAQMVVSFIPGVGTAISTAIGMAVSLANGKPITEAMLDAVRGALPGGPAATAAFDLARNLIRGENVLDAALDTARAQLPEAAQAVFDTGVALAKGQKIQDALAAGVRRVLPHEAQGLFDAGVALANGRNPADALAKAVSGFLPPEAGAAMQAAGSILSGKNPLDAAKDLAASVLPDNIKGPVAAALTMAQGKNLADAAHQLLGAYLPPDVKKIVDTALPLVSGKNPAEVLATFAAKNLPPEAAAAVAAAEALRAGKNPLDVAPQIAQLMGGSLPPTAAKVLTTVNALATGGNAIDVVKSAILGQVSPEVRGTVEGALGKLDQLKSQLPADLTKAINALPLPPELKRLGEHTISAIQGRDPKNVALAVVRRTLPPKLTHTFDAAVSLGSKNPVARKLVAQAESFALLEKQAELALRAAGITPNKLTPVDFVRNKVQAIIPHEVAMQMPAIQAASRVWLAAARGEPSARKIITDARAGTLRGDLGQAKIHENLRLAQQLQQTGQIMVQRGLTANEIRAMIALTQRAVRARPPSPMAEGALRSPVTEGARAPMQEGR